MDMDIKTHQERIEQAAEDFSYAQAGMQTPFMEYERYYKRAVKEGFQAGAAFGISLEQEDTQELVRALELAQKEIDQIYMHTSYVLEENTGASKLETARQTNRIARTVLPKIEEALDKWKKKRGDNNNA